MIGANEILNAGFQSTLPMWSRHAMSFHDPTLTDRLDVLLENKSQVWYFGTLSCWKTPAWREEEDLGLGLWKVLGRN